MNNEENERRKEPIKSGIEKGITDIMERTERKEGNDTVDNIEKIVKTHKKSMV